MSQARPMLALPGGLAMRRPRRTPRAGAHVLAMLGGPVGDDADRLAAISRAVDDHVHTALTDEADAEAVSINLGGLTAQLGYLRTAMGEDPLGSVVAAAVQESTRYLPVTAVEGAARS